MSWRAPHTCVWLQMRVLGEARPHLAVALAGVAHAASGRGCNVHKHAGVMVVRLYDDMVARLHDDTGDNLRRGAVPLRTRAPLTPRHPHCACAASEPLQLQRAAQAGYEGRCRHSSSTNTLARVLARARCCLALLVSAPCCAAPRQQCSAWWQLISGGQSLGPAHTTPPNLLDHDPTHRLQQKCETTVLPACREGFRGRRGGFKKATTLFRTLTAAHHPTNAHPPHFIIRRRSHTAQGDAAAAWSVTTLHKSVGAAGTKPDAAPASQ
jgi:hypothetical protein